VVLDTPISLKQKHGDTIIEIETIAPVSSFVLAQLHGLKSITEVTQNSSILRIVLSGDLSVTGKIVTIVTQEINIKTISQREPNLEEIFLDLTGGALRD